MYCPQCGTESSSGLQFCRSCGANLKVIGKALTLSEAIGRSDRGPLPKIKEMFKNFHVDRVTDEVSRALEKMNKEILRTSPTSIDRKRKKSQRRREKTAEERREERIGKGTVSFFTGIGLMIFLYFLSTVLVLRLPPDVIAKIPFELEPVIRIIWLLGLIPTLSGIGQIIAGLQIRPQRHEPLAIVAEDGIGDAPGDLNASDPAVVAGQTPQRVAASVTENTTHLLEPPG
jgi:hypothetical protein